MRIAYIYSSLNTVGGADRIIIEKANYFAEKHGYEIYIITDSQGEVIPFFPISDKVNHIDLNILFNRQYKYSLLIRAAIYFKLMSIYKKKLTNVLMKIKPDITITTLGRDIEIINNINDGSIKIGEAHVAKEYIRNLHLLRDKNIIYQIIAKIWTSRIEKSVKKLSCLVALTENDANAWNKFTKTVVIPNSTSIYPKNPSNCTNKKIISLGRLNEQKGYNQLINAWTLICNKYPEWSIHIFGNGELKKPLLAEINKNQISDSFFIHDPVTNIIEKYQESAFYVMSSRFEGFGIVLVEAMACGLPTISFDCPNGPSDIITDGEDGFLVENGNIKQLSKKISFLIENEGTRISMGKKARENVKRFLPNEVMKKWIDLFESLK